MTRKQAGESAADTGLNKPPEELHPLSRNADSPRNAVVVVVDRLSASYLGCYGNTWLDTPELNRIASESLLFEFATTDSAQLLETYRSYWWGSSPGLSAKAPPLDARILPGVLREARIFTCLVTDDPEVANLAPLEAWDRCVMIHGPASAEEAPDIAQTRIAQVFAAALETLETLPQPFLLWVHSRGMEASWDAPYALRLSLIEEEDPEPPTMVEPPRTYLPPTEDPDVRWGFMRAYAGQVLALDLCAGTFWDSLQRHPGHDETLVLWTSPRGYPLGEHGDVGGAQHGLHGETIHVPWWIGLPHGVAAGARSTSLIHPPDLAATLLDWWELEETRLPAIARRGNSLLPLAVSPVDRGRPYVVSMDGEMLVLRTTGWMASRPPGHGWQLFVKPDDRFEANEVSARCLDIIEELDPWMRLYQQAAAEGFTSFPRLPEPMVERDG